MCQILFDHKVFYLKINSAEFYKKKKNFDLPGGLLGMEYSRKSGASFCSSFFFFNLQTS